MTSPARRRYLVLPYPLRGEELPSMMGRVVEDILDPLRSYRPLEPPFVKTRRNPEDILPNILPQPIASGNRKDVVQKAKAAKLKVDIMKVLSLDLEWEDEERVAIEGEKVERYTMSQDEETYKLLMRDPEYSRQVCDFVNERGSAFFVTGFYTTENTKWDVEAEQRRQAGLTVQMTEIMGAPSGTTPIIPVGVAANIKDSLNRKGTEELPAKLIFAVQYDTLKKRSKVNIFSSGSPKDPSTSIFRGPTRIKKGTLALGPSQQDSESEEDNDEDDGEASFPEFEGGVSGYEESGFFL